ncbi:MAG: hypothetical protein GOMPHAMPRED_002067 [Gomphillus americanus]|uniref:U1 small nuclear ribonucleoprotein C n=1 Tax=Gomphillus americanus TaxID=1940652 RepID=A0A8H3FB53_9LECA|nr:MAG: hypothetical protein GOMPHAMPRED_002067 [Gomphillus americanus]
MHISVGDYCDVYLTHDSMSVRKAHNSGKNHLRNVTDYYQRKKAPKKPTIQQPHTFAEIGHDRAQSVIDSITNSYAVDAAAGPNPGMQGPPGSTGAPPMFAPNMGRGMPMPFQFPPNMNMNMPPPQFGPPPNGMMPNFPMQGGPPPGFAPQNMPMGPSPLGPGGFGPPPGFGGPPGDQR